MAPLCRKVRYEERKKRAQSARGRIMDAAGNSFKQPVKRPTEIGTDPRGRKKSAKWRMNRSISQTNRNSCQPQTAGWATSAARYQPPDRIRQVLFLLQRRFSTHCNHRSRIMAGGDADTHRLALVPVPADLGIRN